MKIYQGVVVKRSSAKTITVEVTRKWVHPKYKKTVKRTKKYLVHDQTDHTQIGEHVIFAESKPRSKRKHFSLLPTKQSVKKVVV